MLFYIQFENYDSWTSAYEELNCSVNFGKTYSIVCARAGTRAARGRRGGHIHASRTYTRRHGSARSKIDPRLPHAVLVYSTCIYTEGVCWCCDNAHHTTSSRHVRSSPSCSTLPGAGAAQSAPQPAVSHGWHGRCTTDAVQAARPAHLERGRHPAWARAGSHHRSRSS
eukprot:COSAG02_NODE_1102_length_14571_cov_27.965243_14_plen_168_part_00